VKGYAASFKVALSRSDQGARRRTAHSHDSTCDAVGIVGVDDVLVQDGTVACDAMVERDCTCEIVTTTAARAYIRGWKEVAAAAQLQMPLATNLASSDSWCKWMRWTRRG
jgi:hypothetical protein